MATSTSASVIVERAIADLYMECLDVKAKRERNATTKPQTNADSQCFICSKIYYNATVEKCTKCGGRCTVYAKGLSSNRYSDRVVW